MKNFNLQLSFTKIIFVTALSFSFLGWGSFAQAQSNNETNILDELNPHDPQIEEKLKQLDQSYLLETGESPLVPDWSLFNSNCLRQTCTLWAHIVKSQQKMYLYINGSNEFIWDVSTGVEGLETPDFDRHPDGRIYDRYTSTRYPGGDYNGLGNMPYAVFIRGGFAIHGTGVKNWVKLGQPASHGCIRLHPDNAKYFNRLVRQYGVGETWITVE